MATLRFSHTPLQTPPNMAPSHQGPHQGTSILRCRQYAQVCDHEVMLRRSKQGVLVLNIGMW